MKRWMTCPRCRTELARIMYTKPDGLHEGGFYGECYNCNRNTTDTKRLFPITVKWFDWKKPQAGDDRYGKRPHL